MLQFKIKIITTLKIDQYLRKEAIKMWKTTSLKVILQGISSNNINIPKNKRKANVFATRTNLGRKHKDIKEFTGLLFIDIDKCKNQIAVKELFIQIDNTVAAWYSSSGKNVHALIKIPICTSVDEYKRRYNAFIQLLEPYIRELAKVDKITANPTQLAFESFDPAIFINNVPIEFELILPIPKPKREFTINSSMIPTNNSEHWCIRWLENKINNIVDNGYTQLLSISRTFGGYCSGGYINKDIAMVTLKNAVRNNTYLNGNSSSGTLKTYLKGAEGAFINGELDPLTWDALI